MLDTTIGQVTDEVHPEPNQVPAHSSEAPPVPGPTEPSELPVERVGDELCRLAGQIAAATSRFLRYLADFDARRGWAGVNIKSCAHWLSWRCGLDLRTAREHVRVAKALTELPKIRDAFDRGRISYSKVRAIARVATSTSEADLLEAALHAPAAHVERLTRGMRTAQRNALDPDDLGLQPQPQPADSPRRRIRWHWDYDNGDLIISGRLAPEDGARLLAAATRACLETARCASEVEEHTANSQPASALRSVPADSASTSEPDETSATTRTPSRATPATQHAPMTSTPAPPAAPSPATPRDTSASDGSAEPPEVQKLPEPTDTVNEPSDRRSSTSSGEQAMTTRPPSDLGPALLAMAEMVSSGLPSPVHAPAADVLVTVDIQTLAEAFADRPATASAAPAPPPRADTDPPAPTEPASTAEPVSTTQPASTAEPASTAAPKTSAEPDQGADTSGWLRREAHLDDGPALAAATLRRLADDGRLRFAVNAADGRTLDVGRARRTPNTNQLQALWRRDRGCAVPGCGRIRFLHAHHVVFWTNGGRTDLDNLILLCGEHHRALHDGAFTITALGRQRFRFNGASGAEYCPAPATSGRADDLAAEYPEVDPTTIQPDWNGEPVHNFAVSAFLTIWNERIRRNRGAQDLAS